MEARSVRRLIFILAGLALLWAAGFTAFIASIPKPSAGPLAEADGVAVYTGGGGVRISAAMAIFADGAGKRLLISGVHPDTSAARLSDFWVGPKEKYECCVDLGREALTTEGNAGELSSWAESHRFNRIILVTSDYHMPRAVAVTKCRMPNAEITPYAVSSGYLDQNGSPTSIPALLRLSGEYSKFLLARVKVFFLSIGR